jgi:DNA replication protein DnaC
MVRARRRRERWSDEDRRLYQRHRWRSEGFHGEAKTWHGLAPPPGGGKSHLSAAIGVALVENGWRVLFARTTDLVQRLQVARRELTLESAITKLDRYDLLILDDIAYVTKDQAETSVLFELIAARYERRSLLITANQPFGEWGRIFPDQAMTLAAIDRLVHHATIMEMNVESYRRKAALERKRGRGRPPAHATPKEVEKNAD